MTGISRDRLKVLRRVMEEHVGRGALPGLALAVSRHGETHMEAIGTLAVGGRPVRSDSLFRITSMTKPVVAVAAMMLVEEDHLGLDEPVDPLLPELADRRVLRRIDGPLEDTEPAARPITLRDLLTFRMGFGLSLEPSSHWPIERAARELQITLGPPLPRMTLTPDEFMRRLGSLPLMHHPGDRWMYNLAYDVLGVLIARASGQALETFLRERIFAPLGMRDTGFHVPAEKLDRFAAAYEPDGSGGIRLHDGIDDSPWTRPPTFPQGRDGLVSTLDDYLHFGRMMLGKGLHEGRHLLSRESVEAMITDHITPGQKARSPFFPGFWEQFGWGFGVSVVTNCDGPASMPGRFGWSGGYGTTWWSDPAEDLVAVLMTQRLWADELFRDFEAGVYQAIG